MCILFIYNSSNNVDSDYLIILAANRDEYLDRPSKCMEKWSKDFNIYGGQDLESGSEGGSWLALNIANKKLGVLLNLPGKKKENVLSRGRVVADYVKSELGTKDYVEKLKSYDQKCNEFVFVTVEFGNLLPAIKTYSNASNRVDTCTDACLGFGNSLPDNPLTKVKSGKSMMMDICMKHNKIDKKEQLIEELVGLLKNEDKHLPDPQLESRQPHGFKDLSSIFVKIPSVRYGTRAHTIFILTKKGHVHFIEISLESPIDIENLKWKKSEYEFDLVL